MSMEVLVRTAVEDFDALEREIRRELLEHGPIGIDRAMEAGGYLDELERMRERISELMTRLREMLGRFAETAPRAGEDPESRFRLRGEIEEMQSLLESLMVVWQRLLNLVDIVEQRVAATAAGGQGVVAKVRSWLSTIMTWLKGLSGQLWRLLSGLMKPKEWSVSGTVAAAPFGLANATIEITFGP